MSGRLHLKKGSAMMRRGGLAPRAIIAVTLAAAAGSAFAQQACQPKFAINGQYTEGQRDISRAYWCGNNVLIYSTRIMDSTKLAPSLVRVDLRTGQQIRIATGRGSAAEPDGNTEAMAFPYCFRQDEYVLYRPGDPIKSMHWWSLADRRNGVAQSVIVSKDRRRLLYIRDRSGRVVFNARQRPKDAFALVKNGEYVAEPYRRPAVANGKKMARFIRSKLYADHSSVLKICGVRKAGNKCRHIARIGHPLVEKGTHERPIWEIPRWNEVTPRNRVYFDTKICAEGKDCRDGALHRYDPASNRVSKVSAGPRISDVSPNGKYVVVRSKPFTLKILDLDAVDAAACGVRMSRRWETKRMGK